MATLTESTTYTISGKLVRYKKSVSIEMITLKI